MRFPIILSTLIAASGVLPAKAQSTLEENAPPGLAGPQLTQLPGGGALSTSDNSEQLGVSIAGIRLVGEPGDVVPVSRSKGVTSQNLVIPEGMDLDAVVNPFLGRPLSFKAIGELRNAIVAAYRRSGRAFVSVIAPPQEVSAGVVQLIVTESRLSDKTASGLRFSSEGYILENVQADIGETIDTDELIEDLNWLNLNPYRNLSVVAEPGKQFGETVLNFRANEQRPWAAYLGYNNTGTPDTDRNRIFAGVHIANLPMIDHQFSYQLTASPHAFRRLGQGLSSADQAAYLSHDGYYFVPLPWRHKLRLRAAHITTRSNLIGTLSNENVTTIFSAEYAVPVIFSASLQPDFYGRYEYKNARREIYAGTVPVSNNEIDIHQMSFGMRGNQSDSYGRSNFDIRLVYSPGNVTGLNSDAALAAFTGNPTISSYYFYLYGTLERATPLPGSFTLVNEVIGQWANRSLPSTETLGVGGHDSVRGYNTSEVAGDLGIVLRSELHHDLLGYFDSWTAAGLTQLDAFLFADIGYVKDIESNSSSTLAGLGIGFNSDFGTHLTLGGDLGVALTDANRVKAGDVSANVNINVRF